MDRRFVLSCFFFVLPLLFSDGQAALTFHDIWNLALPQSTSPAKTATVNPSHPGDVTAFVAGEEGGAGEVTDHSKTSVDFGTRGWPYIYYTRRDSKGTVDWGNLAWPYVYYSKKEGGKDDVSGGAAAAATVNRAAVRYGRKGGDRLKL